MIYKADYVWFKLHDGILIWNHGMSVIPIKDVTGLTINTKIPCITLYSTQGTHYLFPMMTPLLPRSRAHKQCVKELGNAFGWIYAAVMNRKK